MAMKTNNDIDNDKNNKNNNNNNVVDKQWTEQHGQTWGYSFWLT